MEEEQKERTFRLVSWNVNGIRALQRKLEENKITLAQFFSRPPIAADVICLQETKIGAQTLSEDLLHVAGYESFYAHSRVKQGYSGVCTFAREGLTMDAKEGFGIAKDIDNEGRLLVTDHHHFVLLNVYFPNGGRGGDRLRVKNEFQEEILRYCLQLREAGRHVIVVGDFNIAHQEVDVNAVPKEDVSGFLPSERQWLSRFLRAGFVDSFRARHEGEPRHFTWWNPRNAAREENKGWRLDYAVVDAEFHQSDVLNASHLTSVGGSDHCPVLLELKPQAALPPHPFPALSSKRKKSQKKLHAFFAARSSSSSSLASSSSSLPSSSSPSPLSSSSSSSSSSSFSSSSSSTFSSSLKRKREGSEKQDVKSAEVPSATKRPRQRVTPSKSSPSSLSSNQDKRAKQEEEKAKATEEGGKKKKNLITSFFSTSSAQK